METLRAEDPKATERHSLFSAWKSAIGVGKTRYAITKDIVVIASHHTELREALLAIAKQRPGDGIDPKLLGKWLSSQEKNIAAGCKLMVDRVTDKSRPRWYLELQEK
jgi:hypothetical protein